MKTKIQILIFLIISAFFFHAFSQTALPGAVYQNEQNMTYIKSFESRYLSNKMYLHITVNGNTETKMVAVERSIDGINYEVIGYVKMIGTNIQCNLAYYFTDESPVLSNLYYRLSDYSIYDEPVYSEIISVIPIDENKTATGIIITTPIPDEQIDFFIGGTN